MGWCVTWSHKSCLKIRVFVQLTKPSPELLLSLLWTTDFSSGAARPILTVISNTKYHNTLYPKPTPFVNTTVSDFSDLAMSLHTGEWHRISLMLWDKLAYVIVYHATTLWMGTIRAIWKYPQNIALTSIIGIGEYEHTGAVLYFITLKGHHYIWTYWDYRQKWACFDKDNKTRQPLSDPFFMMYTVETITHCSRMPSIFVDLASFIILVVAIYSSRAPN